MAIQRFKLFADYFQFLLMDENCEDDFSNIWSEGALGRMLALGATSASVGTLRNVDVNVELHVLQSEPNLQIDSVDHAALGSFSVPSGQLVILGCTDHKATAARVTVQAGPHQVLTTVTGVDTIKYESDPADDLYSVYIWPGDLIEPRLLKHWKSGQEAGKRA
jgi:hypothetical protein